MGRRTSLATLMVGASADEETAPAAAPATSPQAPQWPATVKLGELADNPDNPREALRDLEGLAETIREDGILQSLVVVPRDAWLAAHPHHAEQVGDKPFVIQIGHRRRHAAKLAGLTEVPVTVKETAAASPEQALIENLQRDDLTPLEQARGLKRLMEVREISLREACRRVGKSPGWGSQRMVLLNLTPELQQALTEGRLTVEDAREIGKLPPGQQAMPTPPTAAAVGQTAVGRETEGVPARERRAANGQRRAIPLGSPVEIARSLREQLSAEDLETLVRLLTETTGR
ncbi:ParB/RepB/Spo0J family partition protein [Streptosporangium sandarakinum]|uniref:ParB/RepB/Spo0J family partition protein n=1 Tax=Streptosporangium sandarakinum TaxID=1260955 RepID=UPI0033B50D69